MLWIVITSPSFMGGEVVFLRRLLAHGADFVHLRKPGATADDCARLLDSMTAEERAHIVIHDFFELAVPYGLHGIHLNSRRSSVPEGFAGHVSRSCHSLEEVKLWKPSCDYVFLSPIFDSVSKEGYCSAFSPEALGRACSDGIIDGKVIALGGVTPDRIREVRSFGFGGAAMLGCVNRLACLPEAEQVMELEKIRGAFVSE